MNQEKVIECVACYVANTAMYFPPTFKNSMRELVKGITISLRLFIFLTA
jgi:hypothetical protein